jgi:hypothetical protein
LLVFDTLPGLIGILFLVGKPEALDRIGVSFAAKVDQDLSHRRRIWVRCTRA